MCPATSRSWTAGWARRCDRRAAPRRRIDAGDRPGGDRGRCPRRRPDGGGRRGRRARGAGAEAIGALGRAGVPVVAVDVPSGVDASTGEAATVAVQADVTVTFHAPKLGHVVLPGLAHAGELVVVPIGITAGAGPEPPALLAGAATIAALPGR